MKISKIQNLEFRLLDLFSKSFRNTMFYSMSVLLYTELTSTSSFYTGTVRFLHNTLKNTSQIVYKLYIIYFLTLRNIAQREEKYERIYCTAQYEGKNMINWGKNTFPH